MQKLSEIADSLRSSLDKQGGILKQLEELSSKNVEQDEALQALRGRVEIISSQIKEIQRILRQYAESNLENRLDELEAKQTRQQTIISLFSSVPRPLQWLVLLALSVAAIAWAVHILD